MSKRSLLKKYTREETSEFERLYSCWAINHGGWQKMKKLERRLGKRRLSRMEGREKP
jgi:hypothetical protein